MDVGIVDMFVFIYYRIELHHEADVDSFQATIKILFIFGRQSSEPHAAVLYIILLLRGETQIDWLFVVI